MLQDFADDELRPSHPISHSTNLTPVCLLVSSTHSISVMNASVLCT